MASTWRVDVGGRGSEDLRQIPCSQPSENQMTTTQPPAFDPVKSAWNNVASFTTYQEAQAAVDKLSDLKFAVEELDIVGSDLRLVEHVTGRLTLGRATAAGAASGAWFGL